MAKTPTWLLSLSLALFLSSAVGCGDGGGAGGSSPGGPSDGDGPTTTSPRQSPPVDAGPSKPTSQPKAPTKPKTVQNPTDGTPTIGKLPWDRRGGAERPRTFDDVPSGFSNLPRPNGPGGPDGPKTPASLDPRIHDVETDPSAGAPPVEPPPGDPGTGPDTTTGGDVPPAGRVSPDDTGAPVQPGDEPPTGGGPRTPHGLGGAFAARTDRGADGHPTEPPLPPLYREFPGADVPSVFAPRPGAPDAPVPPVKPLVPGENVGSIDQPRPGGDGRRPGDPVPEPATILLFALGAGFLFWTYRKNAARTAAA